VFRQVELGLLARLKMIEPRIQAISRLIVLHTVSIAALGKASPVRLNDTCNPAMSAAVVTPVTDTDQVQPVVATPAC
jgi:hypothetical protein